MTVYDQEVSRKIFDLVNEERVKEGHAAMIWDENIVIREALPLPDTTS